MDSDVVVIRDTPFNNGFTKLCVVGVAIWVGSIILRKNTNPTPLEQRDRNKRYLINSSTKINKDITHFNRNNIKPTKTPNFLGRHKRFNKFR